MLNLLYPLKRLKQLHKRMSRRGDSRGRHHAGLVFATLLLLKIAISIAFVVMWQMWF
ncbi:hypothetical protein MYX75_13645 [Acidobacteria bacterium AH-259-A15]|nr:hypothetical protein [Acidobacteria bacterium AH-259-A15]